MRLCEIHRRFGELLPDELLKVERPRHGQRRDQGRSPGELRRPRCRESDGTDSHQPRRGAALPRSASRRSTSGSGTVGNNPCSSGGASSPAVDSPVPRRQRPRGAADVACNVLLEALDTGRRLVDCARPRPQRRKSYKSHLTARDLTPPQRSRRQRTLERREFGGVHRASSSPPASIRSPSWKG